MQVIEIISLSGHSPFNISICDITRTYCYVVSTGVVSAPITVEIPTELSGTQELLVVITDDAGCETFTNYNCFTPTPTPTPTITPTITPTSISCNCITFTNTGTTTGNYSYVDCDNQNVSFTINSGTTLYVCGKTPSSTGSVIYSMGLPCVNNTCVPPTPTPTQTPTSSPVIVDCVSYVMTGSTDIFKYNIDTNVLTHLTFPVQPLVSDIANDSNKFWITDIYNPQQLVEYYLVPNPFSATYNRTLYPAQPLLGLCVKNGGALISTITGVTAGDSYIVVEVDITTNTPIIINKFSLPSGSRRLGGDLFYFPVTDKLFVANTDGLGNGYLTQFDYTTGVVEYDVIISSIITNVYGISAKNNKLYLFEYYSGNVYRLDDISIPTFTLVQTTTTGVGAASSDVSCAIEVTPTPTPTMTHTINCVTPVLSSVTYLTGSLYGFTYNSSYACTLIDIEYSRDSITWTGNTGTCSSSRIVDTGDGTGMWYFRIIQLCSGNYTTGNTLTYVPPSPTATPTPTPTPTYPYNNLRYTYIVPEPQDVTSLSELSSYMTASGSTSFLGWGNSGLPSTTDYSSNLDIYIHYSGFTGGSGNFISNVGNLKSDNNGLDSFGCPSIGVFNTIEITPTDVNPSIQYFYTIWSPIKPPIPPSITNVLVNIGYGIPCSSSIVNNGVPDSVLFSYDVLVTPGAPIPSGYYKVLWLNSNCLLPTTAPPPDLGFPLYFNSEGIV